MSVSLINKIDFYKGIKQHQQKSQEWLQQRKGHLTSSDAATALGTNPYETPKKLLFKKNNINNDFTGNEATKHGEKFELEAIKLYCRLMNKTCYDFGLIGWSSVDPIRNHNKLEDFKKKYPDINLSFLAGSPDGVVIDNDNKEDLILLEIKSPFRRSLKYGLCPDYYLPQVQLNMAILDIDKADFIEYRPHGYVLGTGEILDKPEINIVRIHRDYDWFFKNVPILHKFWQDVLYWRKTGIENHPDYQKIINRKTRKLEKNNSNNSSNNNNNNNNDNDNNEIILFRDD